MNDPPGTYEELLEENAALKQKVRELERSEADRKLVEGGLRLSRQQLQLLIDSGPDFFFLKDLNLRYELVNHANARFFGRDQADILGRTDMELMPEEAAAVCQESDRQAIREKRIVITVEPVGDRCYETYKFPVIVAGEIVGVAGIARDITERKRAEEALREVQARYRLLFEHAPDGVVIIDPATARFVEFNETAHQQLGYSREEFAGLSIPDIEAVETREETRKRIENVMRNGRDDFETMHRTKQGEIRNVHVTAQMSEISGHGVYHCVWRDITERKRAEKALQESEEKYRSAVESSFVGIYVVQDGAFQFVNRGFCEITGYTYDEILSRLGPLALAHPDDRKMVESNLRKRITGESDHVEYTFRIKRRDGRIIHLKVFGTSLVYNGRKAAAGTIIDVTREKELEQQLLRTQKLEAIGTLAGGVAHDFNNILAGIMGFTEMVQENMAPDSPEYHRLGLVLKATHRGRDLVEQILTFSRQTEHRREPVKLGGIVEESLKLLRPVFPSTTEIRSRSSGVEGVVLADPAQMHQIVMNLSTNSVQAMGKKGGVLEISVTGDHFKKGDPMPSPDMKPGDYVTLTVRDTGCGMKPDILDRIFDPFFTTKGRGEGTGLGLSVVHGIVKSHGGFIRVESEPGKGSVFYIYLRRMEERPVAAGREEHLPEGGKECILFVDDEDILVELNNTRLTQMGYEVVSTTSSLEALAIFKKEPRRFDLVITDYTMPGMTGIELTRKLLKVRSDIPIILCTGYNEDVSPDRARRAGIKEFLLKPVSKQDASAAIRRALDKRAE